MSDTGGIMQAAIEAMHAYTEHPMIKKYLEEKYSQKTAKRLSRLRRADQCIKGNVWVGHGREIAWIPRKLRHSSDLRKFLTAKLRRLARHL